MTFLTCVPLSSALLPLALTLDRIALGGLWTAEGYQREIESPNSDLLVLVSATTASSLNTILSRSSSPESLSNQHDATPSTENTSALAAKIDPALQIIGLGCLWSILDEAHITTLAIDPNHHRQKLGQFLLTQLLFSAQQRQLTHATLEVRISNFAAIKLYEKFGFKIAGQRKKYYQDNEDALILWRSGLQTEVLIDQLQSAERECQSALQNRQWTWLCPLPPR